MTKKRRSYDRKHKWVFFSEHSVVLRLVTIRWYSVITGRALADREETVRITKQQAYAVLPEMLLYYDLVG